MITVEAEKPVQYRVVKGGVDFEALRKKPFDELTEEESDAMLAKLEDDIAHKRYKPLSEFIKEMDEWIELADKEFAKRKWASAEEFSKHMREKYPSAAAV